MPTMPMLVRTTSKVPGPNTSIAAAPLDTGDHVVPRFLEHLGEDGQDLGVVVHEKDAPPSAAGRVEVAEMARVAGATATGSTMVNVVPRPRLAIHPHLAVVPLHDRIGDGQPEPRSRLALRREEGVEHPLAHRFRHPGARVGDGEHHGVAALDVGADR